MPERQDIHNRRSATCGQEHPRQTLPERQDFDVLVLPFRQEYIAGYSAGLRPAVMKIRPFR
ncbi:MAG: hypothetical protein LBR10_01945, partial [Prevotellaceae bacterium]|nr:hypothetical protein [Prevotellaceae bacterium]